VSIHLNLKTLLTHYLHQEYDQLSNELIKILEHFEVHTYTQLTLELRQVINWFVETFLYVLSQPDYILSDRHIVRLIQLNPVISNLVAISDFKTTDLHLGLLKSRPNNFAKILILYSARNTLRFNYQQFFDTNPHFACLWYSNFVETYRTGLANPIIYQNLKAHLAYEDNRLTDFYRINSLYFGSTYIDASQDQRIKHYINQVIKNSAVSRSTPIRNQPNPKKLAVITAKWFPGHSVHRTLSQFVASLHNDYELTLVHLGDTREDLDTSGFHTVTSVRVSHGILNLESIQDNDFMVAFYPDIGMTDESIFLANLRLAPIQICGTGHPVSTFGSEIDVFVSGQDVEKANAAEHNYSEKLMLLPGFGLIHRQPEVQMQNVQKTRPEIIINCSWYSHKINYPMLQCLKTIIDSVERDIIFRFFPGHTAIAHNGFIPLVHDLEAILGKQRIEVVPPQSYDRYLMLMAEGDFSIDAYPFGGSNVIVDSLYLRKPTVTLKGDRWYNRIGSQMLHVVGLDELVAMSVAEYAWIVLKLIHYDDYRLSLQAQLQQVDLNQTIFATDSQPYFKAAIDWLVQNYQSTLVTAQEPILIH
jgi:predicted O-linked N-acetylglucosamine transferase (SPINDLY family)